MIDFKESHRQRISVAADDFGISTRANKNTLYLISLGKINRVGIMSLGKISPTEVIELSRSNVKLDIHLDILHQFDENRKKRQSAIARTAQFIGKILTGKINSSQVQVEWEKQIEKFHETFGRYPDGINSHEHIHFFPAFFKVTIALQKKYDIPHIRFGNIINAKHRKLISKILCFLKLLNQKSFGKCDCISSDSIVSLDWIDDVDAFLDNLPEGTIEIVCHPEIAEDFVKIKKYF